MSGPQPYPHSNPPPPPHHHRPPNAPPNPPTLPPIAFPGAFPNPVHNIHPVRDLSLSTITTYLKPKAGKPQEVSCIGIRDLIIGVQPQSIDTSCLDRLSFQAWAKGVAEDVGREHMVQALMRNRHIHIVIKTGTPGRERLMLVPPNDRGFRAALKRNFDLTRNFVETDVTFILTRLTSEELIKRYVLLVLADIIFTEETC